MITTRPVHTERLPHRNIDEVPFIFFNEHCEGQNCLHPHFACHINICYGDCDGVAQCGQTFAMTVMK